ncbi:MAG: chromosomal replication initiator protein DnaA [Candidatus Rokubacteria bacterium]|nr:chromosomal replication initiator protein DnaA [Candidatus Rokubacteria bacterium]
MLDSLWSRLLSALETRIPPAALNTWVRPSRIGALDGDRVEICAPNKFSRDWLVDHYLDALQAAAQECLGGNPRVSVVVERPSAAAPSPRDAAAPELRPTLAAGLNPRYTFETFVVGSSNQFAQAACQAVGELPSRAYNPLFLYGGVGLGKTHLLHAVGHQISGHFPQLTVLYLSSERFTNDLINAIRYDRNVEFRAKYRGIDLLLIDDIQFISGKERTQEEFFHTFNDLYDSRKQIVVSSDSPPKDIPDIEERLRSRFEWGLIADIQPPDFETRVAILKKKAEIERIRLPDDIAYLIGSRIKSNIRELEGALTRMIAFCALTGREMSVDLAHEVLSDLWGEDEKIITIEQIQRRVSEFFTLKLSDLKAKTRTKAVAFPRQIAMYLSRQLTHASLAEVGRAFGGKDHTTVLHAVGKVQVLLQEDPKLRKTIDTLTQSIIS